MSDIATYVSENQDTLTEDNLNATDQLVFSQLSYVKFEEHNITGPMSLRDYANEMLQYVPETDGNAAQRELLEAVSNSPRYENCVIDNMDSIQVESGPDREQWAAITVMINDGSDAAVVAMRGTDGTAEGWAEDFELAYSDGTNAQKSSQQYLEQYVKTHDGNIYLTGHSKGGNDCIYAYIASSEEVRERIVRVDNFDGPGVMGEVADKYADGYAELDDKMTTYCPQDSIIGQLLNDHSNIVYVKSDGNLSNVDIPILNQHDAYTWRLDDEGEFIYTEQTAFSVYVNDLLDRTLSDLTPDERQNVMAALDKYGLYALIADDKDHNPYNGKNFFETVITFSGITGTLSPRELIALHTLLASLIMETRCDLIDYREDKLKECIDRISDESKKYLEKQYAMAEKLLLSIGIDTAVLVELKKFTYQVIDKISELAKNFITFAGDFAENYARGDYFNGAFVDTTIDVNTGGIRAGSRALKNVSKQMRTLKENMRNTKNSIGVWAAAYKAELDIQLMALELEIHKTNMMFSKLERIAKKYEDSESKVMNKVG